MNEELKKCPFCGGKSELKIHLFHKLPSSYGVVCRSCGSETWQLFPTEEEAIESWNRRVQE